MWVEYLFFTAYINLISNGLKGDYLCPEYFSFCNCSVLHLVPFAPPDCWRSELIYSRVLFGSSGSGPFGVGYSHCLCVLSPTVLFTHCL